MATDLTNKSKWASEVIGPANDVLQKTHRGLIDLPSVVTPGAKQVAQLTAWRAAQSYALEPIMDALSNLEQLKDWSGAFLVADSVKFDWRTAPIKHYKSFEHFYQEELEQTWGKWDLLQQNYAKFKRGELPPYAVLPRAVRLAETEPAAGERGGQLRNRNAAKVRDRNEGANDTFVPHGSNHAITLVRRIKRDRPDIAARLAAGEFTSARAAGREAGIIRDYPLTELRKWWKRATLEDQDAFRKEIG